MVLLASPSHAKTLHSLTSRSLRRSPALKSSPALSQIRSSFSHLASTRRTQRSRSISLLQHLRNAHHANANSQTSSSSSSTQTGTGSGFSSEEELKRALEAALGSLSQLGKIYHDRESRWREEMMRLGEEREGVEILLRQSLGFGAIGGGLD